MPGQTDYLLLPLRRRDGTLRARAIIDAADGYLAEHRWCLHGQGYAHRKSPDGYVLLHRVILGLTPGDGLEGDHKNRDRLDCRRSNLRVVTVTGNTQNRAAYEGSRSRHRGVYWHKGRGRWRAAARLDGKEHHLGYFADEDDAGDAASVWRSAHMPFTVEQQQ